MTGLGAALRERPEHATDEELEGFVMGLLDTRALRIVEAHVGSCLPCARRLATEARREMALTAALSALPATASRRKTSAPRRRHHGALLAVAAALALVSGLGRQREGMSPFFAAQADRPGQPMAMASRDQGQSMPLLACLQEGDEALCTAAPVARSVERASRWRFTGEICQATAGTCRRQSRPQ